MWEFYKYFLRMLKVNYYVSINCKEHFSCSTDKLGNGTMDTLSFTSVKRNAIAIDKMNKNEMKDTDLFFILKAKHYIVIFFFFIVISEN